jgi:hypothetical protein
LGFVEAAMTKYIPECREDEAHVCSTLASFVLRCYLKPTGEIHARLVDVRTGKIYPISDLDVIPALIIRLLEPIVDAGNDWLQVNGSGT